MPDPKWLQRYSGETAEELLSLEGQYRIDSLVVAFEQALDQKASRLGNAALSEDERIVLAVEALEREVNNGGYSQFFLNSSSEYAGIIVDSLRRVGCPVTAGITQKAINALKLTSSSVDQIEAAMAAENEDWDEELGRCDDSYYNSGEDIAGRLFAFIKANVTNISLTSRK
jgi:hypothetical protein